MSKATAGLIAGGIVGVPAVLIGIVVAVASMGGPQPTHKQTQAAQRPEPTTPVARRGDTLPTSRQTRPAAEPTRQEARPAETKPAKDAGPWPECEAVLKHLRNTLGDPDSLQVIEWKRRQTDKDGQLAGIVLQYRAKNNAGAMESKTVRFGFYKGKIETVLPE